MPTKDQRPSLFDLPDEPLSEDDCRAVREGQAEIARGEFTTLAELKRELNL